MINELLYTDQGKAAFQKNSIDAKETVPLLVLLVRSILGRTETGVKSNIFAEFSVLYKYLFIYLFIRILKGSLTSDEETVLFKVFLSLGLMCADNIAIQFILIDNGCLLAILGDTIQNVYFSFPVN